MENILSVRTEMLNAKMQYRSTIPGFAPLISDYPLPLGDNQGPCSLELFLVSFSTCTGNAISHILRKMRKDVRSLSIKASGRKRMEHPMNFESITLEIHLTSPDTNQDELDRAIALAEGKLCPVWNMIKGNVPVIVVANIAPNLVVG